jgi:hypothetical protein
MARLATISGARAQCACSITATVMLTSDMRDPTDKSNIPLIITHVTPQVTMPRGAFAASTPSRFE